MSGGSRAALGEPRQGRGSGGAELGKGREGQGDAGGTRSWRGRAREGKDRGTGGCRRYPELAGPARCAEPSGAGRAAAAAGCPERSRRSGGRRKTLRQTPLAFFPFVCFLEYFFPSLRFLLGGAEGKGGL